jgi:hypothetical protein
LAYPACATMTSFDASELVRIRIRTPCRGSLASASVPSSPGTCASGGRLARNPSHSPAPARSDGRTGCTAGPRRWDARQASR